MVRKSEIAAFQFVNSSNGLVPQNGDIRTQIRKQAMSRVASNRKQRGNYGKHNLRQLPVYVDTTENIRLSSDRYQKSLDLDQHQAPDPASPLMHPEVIPMSMPNKGYDSMRVRYGFDILDLSSLTAFHVGRVTAQALTIEPSRLIGILQCQQWSYFSYLPGRYGNSSFLDDAVNCVAARVRQLISYPLGQLSGTILSLYSRALRSLQAVLDDPKLWMEPDVLCATEVLALFELLNRSRDTAWEKHAAGATMLVQLRGPESYNTDYEKALFLAHVGPLYTEAFFNNTRCILEEESWKAVMRSIMNEKSDFSSRSEIVILLWTKIGAIPSLFKDVSDAICNSKALDSHKISYLTSRIRQLYKELSQWHQDYERLFRSTGLQNIPGEGKWDKRLEILGIYITSLIKINRLSLALNPLVDSEIEDRIQSLAHQIMRLEKKAYATNPRAALFLVYKTMVSQATIATEGDWRVKARIENGEEPIGPNGFIKKQIFENWCNLMGRKTS